MFGTCSRVGEGARESMSSQDMRTYVRSVGSRYEHMFECSGELHVARGNHYMLWSGRGFASCYGIIVVE